MLKKSPLKYLITKASFVLVTILLLIEFTCCQTHGDKYLEEGVVEFETKVIDGKHPLADLAPTSATMHFKKDKFFVEMSVLGMFNTMIVCDVPKKTLTQMVKFMNVKQACIETKKEIDAENEAYKINLVETKETKMIAGYKCIKVNATMANDPNVTFEVYYTKDLGVENANELSPYSELKGMLMQYRLKKMGLELVFTAKSVKKAVVPDNIFEIPAYFKIVTPEEMKIFFSTLQ